MKKKYTIEKIIPVPHFVVASIIQIWLRDNQETLFVEDRGGLNGMLTKYEIKNEILDVYDCSHLIGRKCEADFDNNFQIKTFNFC